MAVKIAAARFPSMSWVAEVLGAKAILAPGQGARDHARAAIQWLSPNISERQIFTHLGWRQINGQWVYLHAGGAIGPSRREPGIEVALPSGLERYTLPAPPDDQEVGCYIHASLRVLELMPARITYPSYVAVWRAVLGEVDCSLFLYGKTGQGKSEWAALLQQHFGPEMNRLNLPANFSSTGNSLEALAFHAKDALLVIDEFYPAGSLADMQRGHKEADRILRAQGNPPAGGG